MLLNEIFVRTNRKRILILFIFFSNLCFSQVGWWTWMKGSHVGDDLGNFGTMGVTAASNNPPAVYQPASWTDSKGIMWLFGGVGSPAGAIPPVFDCYSALWKYDPATNNWTWVKGPMASNQGGVYGTKGVAAPTNNPGARAYGVATWVDNQDNLWMFGGQGLTTASGTNYTYLADLWKYDPVANMWTWVSGSNGGAAPGVYGTKGIPSPANYPKARYECNVGWKDLSGNLWLYGGDGNSGHMNDLWKYDIATNQWTWMHGQSTGNFNGNFGTKGVPAPTNEPRAKWVYSHWVDDNGNFWTFGGGRGGGITYNDMWRYEPSTNIWTWMKGSNNANQIPAVPAPCTPSLNNEPAARYENPVSWKDTCGNLWMFSGRVSGSTNDVWCYKVTTNEWVFVGGNKPGSTGTIGVPAATNWPEQYYGSGSFFYKNTFWFFGGADGGSTEFNCLWKYSPDTACAKSSCGPKVPNAVFSGTNLSGCSNLTVNFTNSSTNASAWYWNFGDGNTSTTQNPSNTYITPGQYTVTLIASDGSQSDTLIMTNYVTVYANAVAAFSSSNDTLCIGQSVIFTNSSANSNASSWTFGDGNSSAQTNPSHTYAAVGNYTVTLIAQNANGCNDTITKNIFVTGANITPGNSLQLTCSTSSGTISASSTTPNVTYSWSGTGIISGATTNSPTVNQAGTYTVTVTDPLTGCTNSSTVTVTLNNAAPNITTTGLTLTSCINSSGTINATSTTPNITYSWSGSGIVSGGNTSSPTVNQTGTYTVTVTDPSNGCTATSTAIVNANMPLPTVNVSPSTIPCNQTTTTISATSSASNATYSWSGNGIISGNNNSTATVNAAGTYTITVTDPVTGCTNTTTTIVTLAPGPIAIANSSVTIQQGQSTTITGSGGVSFSWYPTTNLYTSSGNIVIASPLQTTVYCVEVTDNNGCKDTACVTISVEIPCPTNQNLEIVPNAFSPNQDGVNEEFCLQGWSVCIEEFQVLIFDRWGEKVFESKDPNFCWDGYFRGTLMDSQVFVYYIKATFDNSDKPIIKKGNISLLR